MKYINIKTNKTEKSVELARTERIFPQIFKRQGRIVGHRVKIEFRRRSEGDTTKRKVSTPAPTNSLRQRNKNLFIEDRKHQKIDKIPDEMFMKPLVITLKKNRSGKITLDVRSLNNAILKDKYPMPN